MDTSNRPIRFSLPLSGCFVDARSTHSASKIDVKRAEFPRCFQIVDVSMLDIVRHS